MMTDLIFKDEYEIIYDQIIDKNNELNIFYYVKTSSLENIGVSKAFDDIGKAALLF